MKSKMKRRMLAIVLCMVIALSNSSFIFASSGTEEPAAVAQEGDPQNVQETQTEAAVQDTPAVLSETTPEATPEATPEPTQVPEVTAAPTEAPQATAEPTQAPEVTAAPEATPAPTEAPAVTVEPTQAPEVTAAPETTPEATPVPTEAPVTYNEAVELKHEFKDENGNVTATVTAQIPAGAFQADASELTMEVTVPDQATAEHVKKLMEESLPEHYMLGDTVLYDIRFKVNGTETESQQPIVITFENQNGITVKDVKKAVVFQLDPADPAVEGDKDELVTITQRNDMIESLQNSGQSTDNVDDYDLSEITLKEDGTSNKIQMEGRTSTIYGCYAYYEPVQVLTYEDDQVTVTVSAAENGVIPANAELKVVPITEDKETEDQYKDVEKKLQEKAEEEEYEIAGFLAYDITFVDPEGNETEPSGEVKVSIDYNEAAIPESVSEEDAQNAEVRVLHLEEDEKGEVKEVVDMAQNEQVDVLATTEENKVEKAEVRTESFSTFTITWYYSKSININIINESAQGIGESQSVSGNNIEGINNNSGVSVDEIAEHYIISGYIFDRAVVSYSNISSEYGLQSATEIGKLRYYNSNWQYQEISDSDWENINRSYRNYNVYFVYKIQSLGTVETVDSRSNGITLNLFDYDTDAINRGNSFKFTDGGDGQADVNRYHSGTGSNAVFSNIFSRNMLAVNGKYTYPQFNWLYNSGGSSEYLFSTNSYHGKTVYDDVNHLFTKDGNGYYVYDSSLNYAYYNNDTKDFTVYDVPAAPKGTADCYMKGNFFPFNTLASDSQIKQGNLRNFETGTGATTKNTHFGMTMSATFIQPKDGKVNNQNMVFEFTGDDDVWVFIDGVLVLDIGGIHDALSGAIDFNTGTVTVTGQQDTNLKTLFEKAGRSTETGFENNTFSDYTEHTINFYYLERGEGASNCKLKFNIQTIPQGDVIVEKQLGVTGTGLDNVEFEFKAETSDDNSNWLPLAAGTEYTITSSDGTVTGTGVVGENGSFKLKPGQRAVFKNIVSGQYFRAEEISTGNYTTSVTVSGTEASSEGKTGKLTVTEEVNYVLFVNTPDSSSLLNYDKTTQVKDYENRVYEVNLEAATLGQTAGTEGNNASIVLVLDASDSLDDEDVFVDLQSAAGKFIETAKQKVSGATSGNIEIAIVWYNGDQVSNPNNCTEVQSFLDLKTGNNAETLVNFIDEKSPSGGTPMGKGLQEASRILNHAQYSDKYVLFFTDGMPGYWDSDRYNSYNCMVANSAYTYAEKIRNDQKATIYTVGYGTLSEEFSWNPNHSGTTVDSHGQHNTTTSGKDFLSDYIASDGCAFIATDVKELYKIFDDIAGSIGSNLTTKTEKIEDVIDQRFNLIVEDSASDNVVWTGEDGKKYRLAKAGDIVHDSSGNEGMVSLGDDGIYKITWNNVEIANTADGGWSATFLIKAKEDFIGGNVIPTNKSNSGIYLKDSTIYFPMPTVNVKLLTLQSKDQEKTYFKGESISPKTFIDQLLETSEFMELVCDDNNQIITIPVTDIIGKLTEEQLNALQKGEVVTIDYQYGTTDDSVGTFSLHLDVEGTENLQDHQLSVAGNSVERYVLQITYTAKTSEERASSTEGYKPPVGETVTSKSTNPKYIIHVVAGSITIKKTVSVEDLRRALAGAAQVKFEFTVFPKDSVDQKKIIDIVFDQSDLTGIDGDQTEITKSADSIMDLDQGNYMVSESDASGFETQNVVARGLTGSQYPITEYQVYEETLNAELAIGLPNDTADYINKRDGEVIFTNSKVTKDWQIVKVSKSDEDVELGGAEFALKSTDKTYTGVSADDTGIVVWKYNGSEVLKLDEGTYTLEETKAPAGYQKSDNKWTVVITASGAVKSITAQNGSDIKVRSIDGKVSYLYENEALYDLPSAGGSGIFWYLISGTAFLMAASLILYRMKRKEVLGK